MSGRVKTALSEDRNVSRPSSSKANFFLVTADSERGMSEEKPLQISSVPLSTKEQQLMDDLALLFTVQEERCFSRASRESTKLSRASLTSSQLADASFIYQRINFEMLSKCVPGFVKSHLNKNGRYLPETFILRVNYWRRRRAIGEDSSAKKSAKEAAAKEILAKENGTKENGSKNSGGQANSQGKHASATSQSVSSKHTSSSGSRVTMISG